MIVTAPSFLLESVEQGGSVGRFSFLGIKPSIEVLARGGSLQVEQYGETITLDGNDPFDCLREIALAHAPVKRSQETQLPAGFRAGWVGYTGYDTARWAEPEKLAFSGAPTDDRELHDMHMALYGRVLVFDHVAKTVYLLATEAIAPHGSEAAAIAVAKDAVDQLIATVTSTDIHLDPGEIDLDPAALPAVPSESSMSRETVPSGSGARTGVHSVR